MKLAPALRDSLVRGWSNAWWGHAHTNGPENRPFYRLPQSINNGSCMLKCFRDRQQSNTYKYRGYLRGAVGCLAEHGLRLVAHPRTPTHLTHARSKHPHVYVCAHTLKTCLVVHTQVHTHSHTLTNTQNACIKEIHLFRGAHPYSN